LPGVFSLLGVSALPGVFSLLGVSALPGAFPRFGVFSLLAGSRAGQGTWGGGDTDPDPDARTAG
jgi:hypothetical protein